MPRAGAQHVVIGASAAGVSAAMTMRTSGFEGRITLLDASSHLPYERPPLSKTFPVSLRPIVSEQTYADHGIELRRGARAAELDAVGRAVVLAGGERLPADAVLLATGVSARTLGVPGEHLGNVLTLRDIDDAARVAARLDAGGPLVIVGAGFIGLEAAAVARARGLDVTVVELLPVPLLAVLGADAGGRVRRLHEDRGVRFRLGATVAEFTGRGEVDGVVLAGGERLAAATGIVGCGVVPNDALARQAGIDCRAGVVVDSCGRTNRGWAWAAGDLASLVNPHVEGRQRIEHWDVAMRHGAAVGASMAGRRTPYADVPYFWSDQYGLRLQMYGRGRAEDEIVTRAGTTAESFLAFWLRGGRLAAAAGIGAARDLRAAKSLIEARAEVPPAVLADQGSSLRALARSAP
jgi:3-phenylpropionate/trans-cinnamate dioxygenase ferredoxin reductase component